MIMSLIIGLASIIISVLGLKCTKIGRTSEKVKEQIALSGGILFILSGTRSLETEGLESVRMNERKHLKKRSLSSVFCPSGVFTLTAVSWYAARVINDFHDPFHGGLKSVSCRAVCSCVCLLFVTVCVCAAGLSWELVYTWAGPPPAWPYWGDLCSAAAVRGAPPPPLQGKLTECNT